MNIKHYALFPVLATILPMLYACSAPQFSEPTEGPRAKVRFVTTSSQNTVLKVYKDDQCQKREVEWMNIKVSAEKNTDPTRLNMPLWIHNPNAAKEIYVRADTVHHSMFFGNRTPESSMYACAVPFSFSYEDGKQYETKYQWTPKECVVTVSEIVQKGIGWSMNEVARFTSEINDNNRACLSRFIKTETESL